MEIRDKRADPHRRLEYLESLIFLSALATITSIGEPSRFDNHR